MASAATVAGRSQYVESFDGTRLAVTVFRPERDGVPVAGRFPVIVTQDRSEAGERARVRQFFVDRGYVVVAQDRRGTGASFGTQTGFVTRDDVRDASYYTKRSLLAAVWASTFLFWLEDRSPDFEDSWAFLDRRIDNVMQIGALRARFDDLFQGLGRLNPLAARR